MAKFNLTTLANDIARASIGAGSVRSACADLREQLEGVSLSDNQKVSIDKIVVGQISAHYGVAATQAQKNGKLSGLCFSRGGLEGAALKAAQNATFALNFARNRFIDPKTRVEADPVEKVVTQFEKLLNDKETRSQAVRAIKRLMLAISK